MVAATTLTKRERQIAELIAWGASTKEIADRLYISVRTVENTARAIYEKIGVTKANELSAWWFCTMYGISFDGSPIKKAVLMLFILFVLIFCYVSRR